MPKKIKNNKTNAEIFLNKLVVVHDAVSCFNYLYPDLTEETDELNDLYNLAKAKNSEAIVKVFEQDQFNLDFDFDLFQEHEAMMVS
jgi:hypothetical protein